MLNKKYTLLSIFIISLVIINFLIITTLKNQKEKEPNKDELLDIKIEISEDDLNKIKTQTDKEPYVKVNAIINGQKFKNCALRTKGSTGYELVKKSNQPERYGYRLELDYYIKDQHYNGITKISLNNGVVDKTAIREMVAYDIYEASGVHVPKRYLCELTLGDKNEGIYTFVEIPQENFLQRTYGNNAGNLYKPKITVYDSEDITYKGDDIQNYTCIYKGEKIRKKC